MTTTTENVHKWLLEIATERGLNPEAIQPFELGLRVLLALPEGVVINVNFCQEGDGYFLLSANCLSSFLLEPDWLLWHRTLSLCELFGMEYNSGDDGYVGIALLRIRPQSKEDLLIDMNSFLVRIELAQQAFRKAASASPTGNAQG